MTTFCRTRPDCEVFGLLWEIEQFCFVREMSKIKGLGPRQDHIRSRLFGTPGKSEWALIMYPNGATHSFGHVGVYLHALVDIYSHVKFSFALLDRNYEEVPRTRVEHTVHRMAKGSNWGFPKYLSVLDNETFNNFMHLLDDKIRLKCEVQVYLGVHHGLLEATKHMQPDRSLADDIKEFTRHPSLLDASIICGGDVFPASKFVLAARSQVILDLLDDQGELKIYIDDMKPEIAKQFVDFVHSDRCDLLDNRPADLSDVMDLCILAHRFKIKGLIFKTLSEILDSIGTNTVLQISQLAETIRSKPLNEAVNAYLQKASWARDVVDGFKSVKSRLSLNSLRTQNLN